MIQKIVLFFFLLIASTAMLHAQSQDADSSKKVTSIKQGVEKEELDTEESIKYMGNRLWYQLKKRLHMTSEEEEKEEQKNKKPVRLNIGGFRIERSGS